MTPRALSHPYTFRLCTYIYLYCLLLPFYWILLVTFTDGCQFPFPNASDAGNQTCLKSCLYDNGTVKRNDCYVEDCAVGCHIDNINLKFQHEQYRVIVGESQYKGTVLLTVRLVPSRWNISAKFELRTGKDKFSVDDAGNISLTNRLDREAQGTHLLTVGAEMTSILGIPVTSTMFRSDINTTEAMVTITVQDINDHPPKFSSSEYRTAIVRDELVGAVVLRMSAVDRDTTLVHRNLTYSIEASSLRPLPFAINKSSGALTLTNQLDEDDFVFRVVVTDGLFNATADVVIEVVSDTERRCRPNPCQPNGRCVPKQGSFDCVCQVGFTGLRCQRLKTCSSDNCLLENGRCVDGPNLGGCVKPANIELTDFYQPAFPFNSIQHPAIEIPKVAYPALCYSTLQLVHVTGQISAFKADIDIIYTSDHGDLNVTVSEIEDKGATIFLQVCCKEFGCFSVGSLQTALSLEVGHTFSLHDEIIISVVSCPLLTELQFGSVSCSGNEYRDICTLKCNYGYTIRDHVFSTDAVCGADGRWHGSHSTCLAVDCGDFPVSNNPLIRTVCNGTRHYSSCTVTCPRGYSLSIPGRRVCLGNGTWSTNSTLCIESDYCILQKDDCNRTLGICQSLGVQVYECLCKSGYGGNGKHCGVDSDQDGIPDSNLPCNSSDNVCRADNCRHVPNSGQEDADSDGVGDACDRDDDNDFVDDREDNCDFLFNPLQNDTDRDGQGDECDPCPNVADDGKDTDNDGLGDVCDFDADGDGVANVTDNCPLQFNPAQKDSDQDGVGDLCDNCLTKFNTGQLDRDEDRVGDVCDSDVDGDGDGVDDQRDNCASVPNPDQLDTDEDGLGDVCDVDDDGDNLGDSIDNCRLVENPDQEDQDEDGVGDACEDDADGDGTTDPQDVCPYNKHISRTNFTKFDQIALDPIETTQMDPFWTINDDGEEILQALNSDPGMAIGHDVFNHFEYEGTLYISSDIEADRLDDDFAGFVFGYQNNRKFYVCVWKRRYQVYFSAAEPKPTAFPGIQLKVINSATGPGPDLRDALWQSDGTVNQSRLLWFSDVRWQFDTSYRWHLVHNPANGYMRVTWTQGSTVIADSGPIYDTTHYGGRTGVFVFSQEKVTFSNLKYRCIQTTDYLLKFSNAVSGVTLGSRENLIGNNSFTIASWIFLISSGTPTCRLQRNTTFGNPNISGSDLGMFRQSTDDEFDWTITNMESSTAGTGPTEDHTGNAGFYVYLDVRFQFPYKFQGYRAILESVDFTSSRGCILSFWYHIYELVEGYPHMGILDVEVYYSVYGWYPVFRQALNQGNQWLKATIDLSPFKGTIRVRFVGRKGLHQGRKGEIALDDITFSHQCGQKESCEKDKPIFGSTTIDGTYVVLRNNFIHAGTGSTNITGTKSLPLATWFHISLQYDVEKQQQAVFLNGQLDSTQTVNGSKEDIVSPDYLLLGQHMDCTLEDAWIDEVGPSMDCLLFLL